MKSAKAGELGGSAPEVYVGQLLAPFYLPCHSEEDYRGNDTEFGQTCNCVGASIMRHKVGIAPALPPALLTPFTKVSLAAVYDTLEEFYGHHKGISIEEAAKILRHPENGARKMVQDQMNRASNRVTVIPRD